MVLVSPKEVYIPVYKLLDDRYEELPEGQEFVLESNSFTKGSHEEASAQGVLIGFQLEEELGATFSRVIPIMKVPTKSGMYHFPSNPGRLQDHPVSFPLDHQLVFPDRPSEDHRHETKH